MSVIFFGTSSFAVPILEALAQSEWRPGVVITAPDRPAGRGLQSTPSPAKQKARALGLKIWEPERLRESAWADRIEALKPSIIVLAAYGKIIPPRILAAAAAGSLNVHPSLLPRWRGPAPVQYSIFSGETLTGVTLFLMDAQADHGPIIAQESLAIAPDDTTATLEKKLGVLGASLLLRTLPDWLAGKITPQPQDHSQATFSEMIKKEDGLIDWSLAAEEIARRIRAFQPWPGSYTFWKRQGSTARLVIVRTLPHPDSTYRHTDISRYAHGAVLAENKELLVATGEGVLEILALQPEGKKSMAAGEFLNGHGDILGTILTAA